MTSRGITLGICPNVWVDLQIIEPPPGKSKLKMPLEYRLRNPEQVALQLNLEKARISGSSKMSPRSLVNCEWAQRLDRHIPLDAHTFVWANPIMNEPGGMMYAAENDLICFLAYGGFVFFDRWGDMVKINGVKVGKDLDLVGPFGLGELHLPVFRQIKEAKRLNQVTLAGIPAENFAWVLPDEFPDCPNGAFVYECEDPNNNYFFKLEEQIKDPDEPARDLGIQLEFMDQQPYVASISENSPLRICGVRQGDAIVKWAEQSVTNRDTLLRIYKQAKYDKAVTLVVRHSRADDHTGISYCYFRMKEPGWAEAHANDTFHQHRSMSSDCLSAWEQSSFCTPRHPTLGIGFPYAMPNLDAEASESWERATDQQDDRPCGGAVDTENREDDTKLLPLRIAEVSPQRFEVRFPKYKCYIPHDGGTTVVEGYLSAWTTVNINPDEHSWILPSSDCFSFAYPPETKVNLAGVPYELEMFLINGAWLYFHEKAFQDNGPVPLTQVMVLLGGDDDAMKASGKGHPVTMSLAPDDNVRTVANATAVLQKQGEFYPIPEGSVWRHIAAEGPKQMSWTPPFGIGNGDNFRAGGFIFYFSSSKMRRATFYRFEGQPATFIVRSGCTAEEFKAARKETETLLQGLKGFDPNFTVATPTKDIWSLTCEVPYQLRVATALLAGLGRKNESNQEVVTGKGHYEYCAAEMQPPGIPNVELDSAYPDIKEDLVLDANTMTEYLSRYFSKKFDTIMASMGWIFDPGENQPQVDLHSWYGAKETLNAEQRKALDSLIQKLSNKGFKLLRQWILEARIQIQQVIVPLKDITGNGVLQDRSRFTEEDAEIVTQLMDYPVSKICSGRRINHLRDLYGDKIWKIEAHQFKEIESSTRVYTSNILPDKFFLAFVNIVADDSCAQFWKEQSHQSPNDFLHLVNMRVPEEYKKSVDDLRELLNRTSKDWENYGYVSEADFSTMLNTSISSLATAVCVAQRGYCILDDDNQLQERPPVDLVFLSACAPDFLDPDKRPQARQELQKYFVPPNDKGRWRSHGEYHGRSALMLRIMDIWRRIFAACKDLKVTHPSLLPMGLGIFRPRVAEEDTYYLYFEAQLTVMEEEDYGFHTVFLNPGRNMPELLHVLSKRRWHFPFNLQVHTRDAKSVANALAKHGKRSCILIPADFLAVLQGYVGSWWECGHNERYTGESHIVATSTAVLARKNISRVWSGQGVVHTLSSSKRQVTVTVPVCSYVLKVSKAQPVVMTFAQMVFIDLPNWWGKYPDKEPECLNQVTALLRRSQWGAIDIKTVDGGELLSDFHYPDEDDGDDTPNVDPSFLREKVFNRLLESVCKEGDHQVRGLEDLNAIVIRMDVGALKQWSYKLAFLLSTLLDLRVKSLFHGVIIAACVETELSALEARHVMTLGADWVFPYDTPRDNYPVQQTFERFMQDLSRLQRFSSALTQAVYEGRVQVVRKLLTNGADPNHIHPLTGPWAPLHWVHSGHLRDVRGEKKILTTQLLNHSARTTLPTAYPRCRVQRGSTADNLMGLMEPPESPTKVGTSFRLWGLWVTLDAQAGMDRKAWINADPENEKKWVDMDRTPVARLRWAMMNHYSLNMWQVYLSHFEEPSQEQWAEWLPGQAGETDSLLAYLRYIVVEVVTPTTTVGVVKWMDTVVSAILQCLYAAKHPTGDADAWPKWIAESVIVFVHNASVLDGRIENPQLYYRGARAGPEEPDEPVWITKRFPLSKTEGTPITSIDLCVNSCELHDRLERATVHWLKVSEQAELELPIQHYYMAFCMELENIYFEGLHVVEKGNLEKDNKMIQVNLNLMVELTIEKVAHDKSAIKKVQKVVRMPDHVCIMDNLMETPHLLQEIRSSNCLLFLGAGFSFPARLPGWSTLLVEAAKKASGFVKQMKPYDISRDVCVESEKLDNNQVRVMVKKKKMEGSVEVLTEITVLKEKIISMSEEVKQLVEEPKLENLEMAAQLLEDSLGDVLKWLLKGMLEMPQPGQFLNGSYILQQSAKYKQMAARLLMVKHLPVSGILTTNYDQLLCFCDEHKRETNPCSVAKGVTPQTKAKKPQYLNMIRNRDKGKRAESSAEADSNRQVIQIHGSTSDPQSIVLTREGYRGLLHLNPAYSNFLKTVMARSTLLYMGFSFTDGYFNEIRSELMTLQEKSGAAASKAQPFSYAVIDGKPQPVREFFTHHEGVHLFSWQASKYGYGVMDRYLECLLRCTHLAAALSQCKVLLFNPQTSPLFLCDAQQVEVVDQLDLLNEYLPSGWSGQEKSGRVIKWDTDNEKPVEDYLLVKLKEPMPNERNNREMVFRRLLGNAAQGRPFFIPRRYIQVIGQEGELQEDMEVHVAVEMLRNQKEVPLKYDLGVNLAYIQYLVPFGLSILDTRCYLVQLNETEELRLVPHKLLRLDKRERQDERAPATAGTSLQDLKSIARKVAEDAVKHQNLDPVTWANNIQELLHLVQADSLAMNTKAMDHTMETIAEMLEKEENHSLYEASAVNIALANHYQRFMLRSNITALALLTSELALTNCIKTFIIINAANFATPPRAHIELFRHLYDSNSQYIHWAYPPRVIVHTGDSNVQKKYEAVFSEYCLWTSWVSYQPTVQAVMEEIQKPVSSKSTNLPVIFRGRGFFKTSTFPEFQETVKVPTARQRDRQGAREQSKWPVLPFHTLSLAHVNGRQQDIQEQQPSFMEGRAMSMYV